MRANITVVIELPCSLIDALALTERLAEPLTNPVIWQANVVERDSRDGTPGYVSLTIGGPLADSQPVVGAETQEVGK